MPDEQRTAPARCPKCNRVGMDECQHADCTWDQWDDGSPVTEKQKADGAAFAARVNAWLAERDEQEGIGR